METNSELSSVNEELREASLELNKANERYLNAILARIAVRTILRSENRE